MTTFFNEALKKRRSIYSLGKDLPQKNAEIVEIIKEAIKESPSAFNSQSVKAVITFGASSDAIWDITADILETQVPKEAFAKTKEKLASFAAGQGTILFYTDTAIVKGLQDKFPLYAQNFPIWAEQALGGAQQAVWTALAQEGIGASLQHYNPLIDDALAAKFDVPTSWQLRGQMPFGSIKQEAQAKDYLADEERFKIFE
ncbi:nitroreductase family protein [Ligilactobacillus sp. Marseille-Q7487]|uniref:nitroreductase family protein n=1 Tax=Ligilactobacillus sp. Marseille-Q7487 TaxID=3022128 RepID=UPI0024A95A26|nr:nitroreductase family protein [Ligilactobacillus sp. Marseille-Q7487]